MDILYLATVFILLAATISLVILCERLGGRI